MVHAGMGVSGPARSVRQALAIRLPLRWRSVLAACRHFQTGEIIIPFSEGLTLVYYAAFAGSTYTAPEHRILQGIRENFGWRRE